MTLFTVLCHVPSGTLFVLTGYTGGCYCGWAGDVWVTYPVEECEG